MQRSLVIGHSPVRFINFLFFYDIMYSENFLEISDTIEANTVDLRVYTLIKFSEKRNAYLFKRRHNQTKK
jgi:hypothetical protein